MKRPSISGGRILTIVVVSVLLLSFPRVVQRFMETGELYVFSRQFLEDVLARLSGPGRLRFIIQPIVAVLLGIRHGTRDAHSGLPPFLSALAFHGAHRANLLKDAAAGIRNIWAAAILADLISQALIFGRIHAIAALIVGPVLIAVPYSAARGLANRVARARSRDVAAQKAG